MEVVVEITIDDLKQEILKKDGAVPNFLMKKKYKLIKVQTLQSQIQDSVANEESKKHLETRGQANHESREASAQGFATIDPSTGPEAPLEEIIPIPIW